MAKGDTGGRLTGAGLGSGQVSANERTFVDPRTDVKVPDPAPALQAEIADLADLDLHGLRVRWRKLMRKEAPEHLGRALLIRIIAYRLQARVYGDLDAASIKVLDGIARDFERQRKAGLIKRKAVPAVAPASVRKAHQIGTMFIREHQGEMHRVMVVADGFEWRGKVYRSLTEIAQCITGTVWSGPRFFGLRERKAENAP